MPVLRKKGEHPGRYIELKKEKISISVVGVQSARSGLCQTS
jgi:hypothetical protein